ncbi:hypothetical protein [Modestobacter sp. URMC 112]
MTGPSGPPTRALPAAAPPPPSSEPSSSAPAPASFWRQRVPARIGRARTSTVVLGVLFVVLATLYVLVRPDVEYTTVTTETGQTVRVPVSQLGPTTEPAEPATPTTEAPVETGPSAVPTTTDPAEPTTSRDTAPAPTTAEEETEPTGTTRETTSEAPATTEESAPDPETQETTTPTG